ncbi:MAG: hypothetical protein ACMUHM_09245 [Thermoplasmatota archaeon]
MEVHPLVYIGLILAVIVSGVMVNIAKYGWKSRRWTWFFAIVGVLSMLVLLFIVYPSL